MSDNLYFLPIIAKALEQPNQKEALKEAFGRIESMGGKEPYREGYEQFERFIEEVLRQKKFSQDQLELLGPEIIREIIIDLASGTFSGDEDEKKSALEMIRSNARWQEEYEKTVEELQSTLDIETPIEFIVEKEANLIGTISLNEIPGSGSIGNIEPGNYIIKLDTGRVLWKGKLSGKDVLWTEAFPGRALDLAADTGDLEKVPSREIRLLEGELIFRVFPGMETGRIEIQAKASRGK